MAGAARKNGAVDGYAGAVALASCGGSFFRCVGAVAWRNILDKVGELRFDSIPYGRDCFEGLFGTVRLTGKSNSGFGSV